MSKAAEADVWVPDFLGDYRRLISGSLGYGSWAVGFPYDLVLSASEFNIGLWVFQYDLVLSASEFNIGLWVSGTIWFCPPVGLLEHL